MRTEPTQQELIDLFNYDKATGEFSRKKGGFGRSKDSKVGSINAHGRVCVRVIKGVFYAHRLAWIYVFGAIPEGTVIDHIDGNPLNNSIENLRAITQAQNMQNQKRAQKGNKTGLLGVRPSGYGGFMAGIRINGKAKHLGTFATAEEAHEAYLKAKRELHPAGTI